MRSNAAAALAHTMDFAHLDVVVCRRQTETQYFTGKNGTLSAYADQKNIFVIVLSSLVYCLFRADLFTYRATDAHCVVDNGFFVNDGNSGATASQTGFTTDALVCVDGATRFVSVGILFFVEVAELFENARIFGDNNACFVQSQSPIESLVYGFEVVRIDNLDIFNTYGADDTFEVDDSRFFALSGKAGTGVLLVTGHTGDTVVENNGYIVTLVVNDVKQTCDAAVEESAVAEYADDSLVVSGNLVEYFCAPLPLLILAPMQQLKSIAL